MKLIKISEGVMVNPEFITAIESKLIEGIRIMVIRCDGKEYTTTMTSSELLNEMITTETMTPEARYFQFWAG